MFGQQVLGALDHRFEQAGDRGVQEGVLAAEGPHHGRGPETALAAIASTVRMAPGSASSAVAARRASSRLRTASALRRVPLPEPVLVDNWNAPST
jgi:hypothetical protein